MTSWEVLVLGGTGMLGRPVADALLAAGHRVRLLTRNVEKARKVLGSNIQLMEGSAVDPADLQRAVSGCNAVHISLPMDSELEVVRQVLGLAQEVGLKRITYVSATSACPENRWFEVIDVKVRCEQMISVSGIAHTIFRPTWAMETLENFVRDGRATAIIGKNPPPIHFFAAEEFGRIVAASYGDDRALGKQLYVHGPQGIRLPDAIERMAAVVHPELRLMRLKLWQARLISLPFPRLKYVTRLIAFFDQVGELGDRSDTNALFEGPSITLDEWIARKARGAGKRGR